MTDAHSLGQASQRMFILLGVLKEDGLVISLGMSREKIVWLLFLVCSEHIQL
jgi:hypothetical protein